MKTNKTYKTLASAYAAVERAGAERFDLTYNGGQVLDCISRAFRTQAERTVAKWNVVRYEKTICALTCVDGKYAWTAIGTFDSDGLLYPMPVDTKSAEPKQDKPKRTRKTAQPKGKPEASTKTALQLDLDTLAGTGDNSAAHRIMCKHGLKDSRTDEYKAVWQGYWWKIR